MPHPVFMAHCTHLEALKADRMLDAASAATAHLQERSWWERLMATARGAVHEVVERAGPLFTFNGRSINTSAGLRRAFNESVGGARVES